MSIDGTWDIDIQHPLGEQKATATLMIAGAGLPGSFFAIGRNLDVTDRDATRWSATGPRQ